MVRGSEAALMGWSLALAVNAILPHPSLWLIFVVAGLWGALDALQRPSLDAMLPRLVERQELAAAAALGNIRGTLGMIAGPALGGVLVAGAGLPITSGPGVPTLLIVPRCLYL